MEFQLRRGVMKAAWGCSDCSKNKSQAIMSVLAREVNPSANQPTNEKGHQNKQFSVFSFISANISGRNTTKERSNSRTENWRDK